MTTSRSLIASGAKRLSQGPHPERARQDAEALLLQVLGKGRAWLIAHAGEALAEDKASRYLALIERRFQGEPMQYITGEAEFYRLPFRVTRDVLIPRPETELLVERVTQLAPLFLPQSDRFFGFRKTVPHTWREPATAVNANKTESGTNKTSHGPRILDVGTGSGAIAISIAHDWQQAEITAIDISPAALEIARGNAEQLGCADNIRFLEGSLLEPVVNENFEIIVANPPYVATTDRDSLSVEVRDYEPGLALFAGEDGLAIYRRLIPAAFAQLVSGGFLLLEIGYGQEQAIRGLLAGAGFKGIEFVSDLQQIPRVACAWKP